MDRGGVNWFAGHMWIGPYVGITQLKLWCATPRGPNGIKSVCRAGACSKRTWWLDTRMQSLHGVYIANLHSSLRNRCHPSKQIKEWNAKNMFTQTSSRPQVAVKSWRFPCFQLVCVFLDACFAWICLCTSRSLMLRVANDNLRWSGGTEWKQKKKIELQHERLTTRDTDWCCTVAKSVEEDCPIYRLLHFHLLPIISSLVVPWTLQHHGSSPDTCWCNLVCWGWFPQQWWKGRAGIGEAKSGFRHLPLVSRE